MRRNLSAWKTTAIICFLSVLLFHCSDEKQSRIHKYFEVGHFVDQQLAQLRLSNARLVKTMRFDDGIETQTLSGLDSNSWRKELRIFGEHDINKPVLLDAYSIDEQSQSNGGRIETYRLVDDGKNGVLDMEIVYRANGEVASWRSSFKEENLLYSNFRDVSLITGDEGQLTGYNIEGYHKLLLKDTVRYHIAVVIEN